MKTLYEDLKDLASQNHSFLDVSKLHSPENVVHAFDDGAKVVAGIENGKISHIKVVNARGHDEPFVQFELAGGSPAPRPNCVRVCISYPRSARKMAKVASAGGLRVSRDGRCLICQTRLTKCFK